MRVSKKDVICGLPAPTARQLMRVFYDDHSVAVACEVLGLDHQAARDQLCAFESAGYLRQVDRGSTADDERWITTVRGNALAQANFGKAINRATAARHLAGVVERTRTYNADRGRLLTVAEITVFGSYLDPDADRLGDLDIAVIAVRRETNGDRFVDQVSGCGLAWRRSTRAEN
jgi:hypothetical protein